MPPYGSLPAGDKAEDVELDLARAPCFGFASTSALISAVSAIAGRETGTQQIH